MANEGEGIFHALDLGIYEPSEFRRLGVSSSALEIGRKGILPAFPPALPPRRWGGPAFKESAIESLYPLNSGA